MNDKAKKVADFYEEHYPDLWRRCYPRNYSGAGNYESPRYVAAILASSVQWCRDPIGVKTAPIVSKHMAMGAIQAFKNGLPAFFVKKDFLIAVVNSDLPEDLKWTDAKLPYEAGLIYLPKGILRDPDGDSVNVLGWSRNRKGDVMKLDKITFDVFRDDTFVVYAMCDSETERIYSSGARAEEMPYIKWDKHDSKPESPFDMPLSRDDEQFLHNTVCLVFALLLAQSAKPELTTIGRREHHHKNQKRETWAPNFLGRNYAVRRESLNGSHASPRLHWRRGHFRAQHHGVGNQQIRTIWIEPTLVSPNHN